MKPAVLVVDDERSICSALSRTFKKSHYRIFQANSGPRALELLEANDIDVVVSDQRMPGMTGTQLLTIVKNRYPRVGRIILSGQSDVQDLADAINNANIYRFLNKPWDERQLLETVKNAMPELPLGSLPSIPLQKHGMLPNVPTKVSSIADAFTEKQIDLEKSIKSDLLDLQINYYQHTQNETAKLRSVEITWPKFERFEHDGVINIANQSGYINDLMHWYLLKSIEETKAILDESKDHTLQHPIVIDLFSEHVVKEQALRKCLQELLSLGLPTVLRIPFHFLQKTYLTNLLMESYAQKADLLVNLDKRVVSVSELTDIPIQYLELDGKFTAINNSLLTEKRLRMLNDAQNLSIKTILSGVMQPAQYDYAKAMGFDFF